MTFFRRLKKALIRDKTLCLLSRIYKCSVFCKLYFNDYCCDKKINQWERYSMGGRACNSPPATL